MKRSYFLLAVILIGFVAQSHGQVAGVDSKLLRFYESLAERDASHEQSLRLDYQDEMDYWNDQENYERQLGKSNFSFYLVYMKSKKKAYRSYLRECAGSCEHSDVFWLKMRNYLAIPDSTDIFNPNAERVVQSTLLKQ